MHKIRKELELKRLKARLDKIFTEEISIKARMIALKEVLEKKTKKER